ncbi:MAG TPA: EAL domain-containing protein [Pseudogracilibacillus sp.]|nr:EAL domain-containing protein [Pseudogracilibacillus sp.]
MAHEVKSDVGFTNTSQYKDAFTHILQNIDKGVVFTNEQNKIIYINDKFSEITGYTLSEIKGKTPKFLQSGIQNESFYDEMRNEVLKNGKWKGKLWNRTKDGEIYLQQLSIYTLKNKKGKIENFIGFVEKLSGQHSISHVDQLDDEYYDSLTNLPNRVLLSKRLHSSLKLMKKKESYITLIFFQIKNFHEINAKYGLLFGNILLKRIANRLERKIPSNSMLSRWEGTIFALVIESHINKKDVEQMIEHLSEVLTAPYVINGISLEIAVNFGVTIHSKADGDLPVSTLLGNAKQALTRAKSTSELFCFYDDSMDEQGSFVVTESEIMRAIDEREFELYYQPLLAAETNELVGFEALVRWNHSTEGLISPGDFIPLAEKTGLINDIGKFVFEEACRQQVEWTEKGYDDLIISVNLSMNQFKDDFLVHFITETILKTGADPKRINIELTESSFSEDVENTIIKLKQLSELGLTIAMDDFGTGYSSLGYLIDFPINIIKIDRSFIKVLDSNAKIEAIVKAINSMADNLNIEVVAEGVETDQQYELVKKLNCNIVQGFLFDRPRSAKDIEQTWLLKDNDKSEL